MRRAFLIGLACVGLMRPGASGDDKSECPDLGLRLVELDDKWYIVEYRYNACGVYSVPAIRGGRPHYDAQITVRHKGKDIATFRGKYIEKGCFEDDPEMLVKKALKVRKSIKKSK